MINIDIQELKRLYYDEQQSAYEIALNFQTTTTTIYGRMKQHGIKRRTYAEAHKLRHATKRGIILNIDEIVHLYFDKKLTLTEVGERMDVSHVTIKNRLSAAGYKCRNSGDSRHPCPSKKRSCMFTASDLTEIKRLYCEAEQSAHDIALQYDCSDSTIRNHLIRIGVQMRTPRESQELRRKKEEAKTADQHEASISRQLKQLPPLPPGEVTPARVIGLRNKDNLTIDAIAEVCSLTNLEVYNILQGGC